MSMHLSMCVWLGLALTAAACADGNRNATTPAASDSPAGQPGSGIVDASGAPTAAATASGPVDAGGPGGSGGPVPEPTTILLFGTGLMIVARLRRRRPQAT